MTLSPCSCSHCFCRCRPCRHHCCCCCRVRCRRCCCHCCRQAAVPLSKAGECMAAVAAELYGPRARSNGFRTPALVRLIRGAPCVRNPPKPWVQGFRFSCHGTLPLRHNALQQCVHTTTWRLAYGCAGFTASQPYRRTAVSAACPSAPLCLALKPWPTFWSLYPKP